MEEIRNLLQEIAVNSYEVGSACWVDITHINNPHNFYVRPRAYKDFLPILQAPAERMHADEISLGDVVIYKSSTQKSYLRGRILSKVCDEPEPRFRIYAMDIGYIADSVRLRKIWKRKNESRVPSLVTLCQLANCAPLAGEWEDSSISTAMWNYVKGERARMIIQNVSSDRLIVELYNTCPDDIATMLALTGFTTLGYVHNTMPQ